MRNLKNFVLLIFLAVHTSGAIRPATTRDSQRKCGSILCQVVSDLFTKSQLSHGYNYVTTIPAGAMNLTVKQISRSDNLLALRTTDELYLINGNKRASESGIFEYNDDVYEYSRELGTITSRGPLTRPVVLELYSHGQNTGVKYDYILPVPSTSVSEEDELQTQWNEFGQPLDEIYDNNIEDTTPVNITRAKDRKRRKFSWKLLGFGPCNRTCGPGVQQPIFRCIRDAPTRYYSPQRCASIEKPKFSADIYHCNRGLCPAYWSPTDYSDCICSEGAVQGVRTRFVRCVQEQGNGIIENVAESQCSQEKLPELKETCNCPRRRKIYARTPERTPKIYSRLRSSPILTRSIHNSTQPLRRHLRDDRADKGGAWLMSEWSKDCSEECGAGYEHRSIYCDRTPPYSDLCDLRTTPEQKRPCTARSSPEIEITCQQGKWFASEWSNCSGDCFNLHRKRTVLCLRDGQTVDDIECSGKKKPLEVMNCTHREVLYCGPKWHYSEWSECSRPCGEGIQRRYAKCLEYDWKQNALVESNGCRYLDREPVYGSCNLQKCEEYNAVLEAAPSNIVTSTLSPDCSDDFTNCKRINRQRLCKLQYYQKYCCLTCHGYY